MGMEHGPVILREEHRLRVFDNRVLRIFFWGGGGGGGKREELTGD